MKQPLTALRLMASDVGSHSGERTTAALLREVNWLASLVESVLGSSSDPGPAAVDMGQAATHAADVAFTAASCTPSLRVSGEVRVLIRRPSLERAVMCLLDNAIRAAGPGGHVDVQVYAHAGTGRVVITDDGPGLGGLAPQHSLGLSTVRALLADCGGSFELRNGELGGAVATMDIPLVTWK
jgi:signal transduction histidine kinase